MKTLLLRKKEKKEERKQLLFCGKNFKRFSSKIKVNRRNFKQRAENIGSFFLSFISSDCWRSKFQPEGEE